MFWLTRTTKKPVTCSARLISVQGNERQKPRQMYIYVTFEFIYVTFEADPQAISDSVHSIPRAY